MATAVLVISFEEDDIDRVSRAMDQVRESLDVDLLPKAKVYAAIREKAEEVLAVFKGV